jgi:hypothetical protein
MLLVCIRGDVISVMSFRFLILDTYHLDTLYSVKDVRMRGYFSKPKWAREQNNSGDFDIDY